MSKINKADDIASYNATKGLTKKQKAFCDKFIETWDSYSAYEYAYDTQRMRAGEIRYNASKLLRLQHITDYINAMVEPTRQRTRGEYMKTKRILWDIVDNKETKHADRIKALDMINKMNGIYHEAKGLETGERGYGDKDKALDNIEQMDTETLLRLVK